MFRWYHSTIPKLALAFALVFGFPALLLLLFLVGGWLSGRFLGDLLTAITELLWSSSPARYLPAILFLIYFIGAFAAIGSRMLRIRNTSIREWNGRCDPESVIKLCIQQRKQLDGIARERAYCRELCALQATAYSSQGDRELAVQLLENSSELPGAHPDSAGLVALYVYAERAVYQKKFSEAVRLLCLAETWLEDGIRPPKWLLSPFCFQALCQAMGARFEGYQPHALEYELVSASSRREQLLIYWCAALGSVERGDLKQARICLARIIELGNQLALRKQAEELLAKLNEP